jgi:hypothetical protein
MRADTSSLDPPESGRFRAIVAASIQGRGRSVASPMKGFSQLWNLPSEPWIFIVDGKGIIRASFEGLRTAHELEGALTSLIEPR